MATIITDVTKDITTTNEDGEEVILKPASEVADNEKEVEKQWTETKTEKFMIQEKLNQLERIKASVNHQLRSYNEIVDDLQSAKTELGLTLAFSAKQQLSDVALVATK